jgi:hypothetical protein
VALSLSVVSVLPTLSSPSASEDVALALLSAVAAHAALSYEEAMVTSVTKRFKSFTD